MSLTDSLSPEQRSWLIEDERRWQRAAEAGTRPGCRLATSLKLTIGYVAPQGEQDHAADKGSEEASFHAGFNARASGPCP